MIADFNLQDLTNFKAPVLFLDDLEIQSNIDLLEKEVSRIESDMYQPLLLQ